MSDKKQEVTRKSGQTRRKFLATTGAVAGAAMLGTAGGAQAASHAAMKSPKRGGVLRFATRADARGLDPHRNYYYYVSHPLAATSMGLIDITQDMNLAPGLAESWEISPDRKTYTFKMRKGATYHDGADVDAASVKWNFERILNPKIGHPFPRAAISDVETMEVLDKWTIRFGLKGPSGTFLSSVMYYPVQLTSEKSIDKADTHPIGAGPFKFKSWKKNDTTEMERFENWYEKDDQGNQLPYLDGIVGKPKKEDRVRLTALRTDEVDLIDNMAYADAAEFPAKYKGTYNTFDVPQVGTAYVNFNNKNGPFSEKNNPNAHMLRMAAVHAINKDAIHQAVFQGLSENLKGFYSSKSSWYMPDIGAAPEYDPDKAKFLLKKAGAVGEPLILTSRDAYPYMHQQGEIVHAMLTEVGFNVKHEIHPYAVLKSKWRKGQYHIDSTANSYRQDPDAWYYRGVLSTSAENKSRYAYANEKVDKWIVEARQTVDKKKRLELYTEVDTQINKDVPFLYTHAVPLTFAATVKLQGFRPALAGPPSWSMGGTRTAYFES
jgi:peptide/nickel transport system substrate-binding protein